MKKILLAVILGFVVLPARADIVYHFNMNAGAVTAIGTITTDGYIGVFPDTYFGRATHIREWDITLNKGDLSDTMLWINDLPANSRIGGIQGGALSASPDGLYWNFDKPNSLFDIFSMMLSTTSLGFESGRFAMQIGEGSLGASDEQYHSGVYQIATSIETPLPGAFILFMSGLSAIVLLRQEKMKWANRQSHSRHSRRRSPY